MPNVCSSPPSGCAQQPLRGARSLAGGLFLPAWESCIETGIGRCRWRGADQWGAGVVGLVMPGLDPGIHVLLTCRTRNVDGRDKPGHDERRGATKPPDGQISLRDKKLSTPFAKNISLSPSGKSVLPARPVLSRQEGRIAIVTNAGWDAVDAAASARKVIAGRDRTRERYTARKTNDVCCVRQNRVVPTPVAGAKSGGGEVNSTELDQP